MASFKWPMRSEWPGDFKFRLSFVLWVPLFRQQCWPVATTAQGLRLLAAAHAKIELSTSGGEKLEHLEPKCRGLKASLEG